MPARRERRPILGAGNPPLAHRALSANPVLMLGALRDDQLVCDVAEKASVRLQRAIASLSAAPAER